MSVNNLNKSSFMNNSFTSKDGQSKAVSNAMKALQDKASRAESQNIELKAKLESIEK